jgi:hypothetical protein
MLVPNNGALTSSERCPDGNEVRSIMESCGSLPKKMCKVAPGADALFLDSVHRAIRLPTTLEPWGMRLLQDTRLRRVSSNLGV